MLRTGYALQLCAIRAVAAIRDTGGGPCATCKLDIHK